MRCGSFLACCLKRGKVYVRITFTVHVEHHNVVTACLVLVEVQKELHGCVCGNISLAGGIHVQLSNHAKSRSRGTGEIRRPDEGHHLLEVRG